MHLCYSHLHCSEMSFIRRLDVLSNFSVFSLHNANIRRLSISLCLRCCMMDYIPYGFKWRSNLKILFTLDLLQVTLLLTSLNTTSSISFLTSCIAAGFLTDRGLPSLECLVSCIDMFSQTFLQFEGYMYIAYWVVFLLHSSHYFNWSLCFTVSFTTPDACSLEQNLKKTTKNV